MKKLNRPKKFKKKGFPVFLFIFLFLIETVIVCGGIGWYFIYAGKKRIADIEAYTKNYSIILAETFAKTAELDILSKNYTHLRVLFQQKMQENTIDEAFFVLLNGQLVVHSNVKIEKDLKGYLSNDEFRYNLDYIHLHTVKNSKDVHFLDYHIDGSESLFNKEELFYLEKYFYKDINKHYWLVTRGIYNKTKPVGTVAFIISKDRISQFIRKHIDETIVLAQYGFIGAISLAFFISFIIFLRYRSIQKKTLQFSAPQSSNDCHEKDHEKPVILPFSSTTKSVAKPATNIASQEEQKNIKQKPRLNRTESSTKQVEVKAEKKSLGVIKSDSIHIAENDLITIEILGTIDDSEIEKILTLESKQQNKKMVNNDQILIFDDKIEHPSANDTNIKDAIPIRKD